MGGGEETEGVTFSTGSEKQNWGEGIKFQSLLPVTSLLHQGFLTSPDRGCLSLSGAILFQTTTLWKSSKGFLTRFFSSAPSLELSYACYIGTEASRRGLCWELGPSWCDCLERFHNS